MKAIDNKELILALEELENEKGIKKEYMLEAIRKDAPWVIAYASDRLRQDKELMLEACKHDGQELYYASQKLRDDKEVVLTAVIKKWRILKYASENMRRNKEVCIAALKGSLSAAEYIMPEMKEDPDIKEMLKPKEEE